jgi:anti-sigma factor RsiW
MKCPDRKLLARFLDGEEVESANKLRRHVEDCPRCGEIARRHGWMGTALKSALDAESQSMVKESIPCPSAEEVALYVEGSVPLYRKKQLLQHFCACPACAKAVLDAARSAGGSAPPLPQSLVREARGVYGGKNPKPQIPNPKF